MHKVWVELLSRVQGYMEVNVLLPMSRCIRLEIKIQGSLSSVCLLAFITIMLKKEEFSVFPWYIMGAAVEIMPAK